MRRDNSGKLDINYHYECPGKDLNSECHIDSA